MSKSEVITAEEQAQDAARQISAQYHAANAAAGAAVKEMVIFGLMLDRVEEEIIAQNEQKKGNRPWISDILGRKSTQFKPTGLKDWLTANCPEVNYKTAIAYRAAARGVRRLAQIGNDTPLLPLLGDVVFKDEGLETLRQRVISIIQGSSLRVLREAARTNPHKGLDGVLTGRRALTIEATALAAGQLARELGGRVDAYCRAGWAESVTQEERDDLIRSLKTAITYLTEVSGNGGVK